MGLRKPLHMLVGTRKWLIWRKALLVGIERIIVSSSREVKNENEAALEDSAF